jgi:hypothetical protein
MVKFQSQGPETLELDHPAGRRYQLPRGRREGVSGDGRLVRQSWYSPSEGVPVAWAPWDWKKWVIQ